MKKDDRVRLVRDVLQGHSRMHLREIASLLGVSEMTIRRDLSGNSAGLSVLGGHVVATATATVARGDNPDYLVSDESERQAEEKRRIGMLAAQFVGPNDTIFLDCGSTTASLVDFIPSDLAFTAVCNSLNVFLKLQQKPLCQVILTGGTFHRKNMVFESAEEYGPMGRLRLSKAFLSAAGVSDRFGVTCFNFHEVGMKKQVMERSQHRFLLVDHTKFDQVRPVCFAELADFNTIVTDRPVDVRYEAILRRRDITVVS